MRLPGEGQKNSGGADSSDKWHLDGMDVRSVDDPDHFHFNVLVGVALSDQPDQSHGSLEVYPGSHWTVGPTAGVIRVHSPPPQFTF